MRITESELLQIQLKRTAKSLPKAEWMPIVRNEKELLENAIQAHIFEWIDNADNQLLIPELGLIYAVPNGSHKSKTTAQLFKLTGLKSGIPDIHIPVARKGFHSFYIELKTWTKFNSKNNGLSENQQIWIEKLRRNGNRVEVAWSVSETIKMIRNYLK